MNSPIRLHHFFKNTQTAEEIISDATTTLMISPEDKQHFVSQINQQDIPDSMKNQIDILVAKMAEYPEYVIGNGKDTPSSVITEAARGMPPALLPSDSNEENRCISNLVCSRRLCISICVYRNSSLHRFTTCVLS